METGQFIPSGAFSKLHELFREFISSNQVLKKYDNREFFIVNPATTAKKKHEQLYLQCTAWYN